MCNVRNRSNEAARRNTIEGNICVLSRRAEPELIPLLGSERIFLECSRGRNELAIGFAWVLKR